MGLSVQQVTNTALWRRYVFNRQQVLNQLRNRPQWPRICDVCPKVASMKQCLPYDFQLDEMENEVLLLHGTTAEKALKICRQGFDDRMAGRHLYGRGIYFT